MNLNLSQFRKVKEDPQSAVLRHPEGHEFTIAKRGLSPKLQKELTSLPMHYDVGGAVPNPEESAQPPQSQTPPQQPPTIIINNGPPNAAQAPMPVAQAEPPYFTNGTFDTNKYVLQSPTAPVESKISAVKALDQSDQMAEQRQMAEAKQKEAARAQALQYNEMAAKRGLPSVNVPEASSQPLTTNASMDMPAAEAPANAPAPLAPPPAQDPFGTQAYYDAYQKGLQEQKQGLQQGAQAEGALGKQQAELLRNNLVEQAAQQKSFQEHYQGLEKERQDFVSDIQKQHIDPKHYLNSLGTAQKVTTAVGLILGGLGSGLLHQQNPVLEMLQKNIDRDVEAQKTNLGKSESLLTANYRQFGNLRDATDMTRVMQMDVVSNQLKQAAAEAQDPIVKARALQASGQLDQQAAPILSQIAMRKTLTSGLQSGQMNPSQVIRLLVPEKQQEMAYKELGDAQEKIKGRDNALSGFDQLAQINTIPNRLTSPIQTPKQVAAIRNIIAVGLARATAGRVNEYEFEAAKDLYPSPGDDAKTIQLKKQHLLNLVQEKMNTPLLSSYGINLGNAPAQNRYGASGEKRIQLGAPVPMTAPMTATSPSQGMK